MKDNKKIQELNDKIKALIIKYKTYHMSDKERIDLRNEIEDLKNTVNCITNMRD